MDFREGPPFHRWLQGTVTHRVIFEMVDRVSHRRWVEQGVGFRPVEQLQS